MKRHLMHVAPLIAAIIATSPAFAAKIEKKAEDADKGAVVATVNGKAIPKTRVELLVAAQKAQGRPDSDDLRNAIRERLIMLEVVVQEAQKKGLDKKPETVAQMDMARQDVLINAYLGEYVRAHQISAETIQKEYDNYKTSMGDREYKARHILVEKEDEARDIIARLKKGEKFEDLARQSKDPGSREKGGDLDWSVPSNYVKPFAEALTKLEKGKYTEIPVKSDFGWHVILLEDARAFTPVGMEELKPQIVQSLQRQLVDQHVQELRSKSKVE
ncbi:MAG: peptidylprolyl isomerase [Rhodocyclaceae bacterium]|jgi:peptidyl-prolyl cis-trans isomerase C|nr:peptidylprolyl isomerase [Rhodocyclaceae bacterium]